MFSLVIQNIQRVLFRHPTMEFNQKSSGQIEFRLSAIKQCVIYQAIEIKVSLENDNLIAIINRSKISMAIISHNNCSFERENKQAAQMQFWAIRLFRLMLLYFYYILHPTHCLEKDSTKKSYLIGISNSFIKSHRMRVFQSIQLQNDRKIRVFQYQPFWKVLVQKYMF